MAESTVSKVVNLYQLGQEIGGNPALRSVGPDPEGKTTVIAESVDKATLDSRLSAHVADPNVRPPKTAAETQDENETTFTRDRMAQVVAKARSIMADPANSADWTAGERKVILAALVLDAARRLR